MIHFVEHSRQILEFIKAQTLMVLSTVTADGKPESSTVECAVLDNGVIVFDTFKSFRKYLNLQTNPNVSLVFGWQNNITVQIEGHAAQVEGQLLEYYQWYYLEKIPKARKFVTMSEIVWFRVVPTWMRFTDVSKDPWETFEIRPKVVEVELRNLAKDELKKLAVDPLAYCHHEHLGADGMAELLQGVAKQTLELATDANDMRWFGYLAIDRVTRDVVGICGFKGYPSALGAVEIAYFTFPKFEGLGYATEMTRQLIAIAMLSSEVRTVCAHTLPSIHASSKILQKLGMHFVGEVIDPEEGKVWKWEIHRKI